MDDRINIIKNNTPLIDLRAPIEFNKGAFPSSVNIPILNDEQRTKVGIKYNATGLLNTDWGDISNFADLVNEITFTRIRYDVVENDAGTDLEVIQINEKENASSENFNIYANHLISTLLESYYKIMVGLEISEDTFMSKAFKILFPL